MGIQINGNTNNINAGIGSLSIEDIRELDIIGVATASNFKTGSSNLHSTGLTVGNNFLHSTGINVGTCDTIHVPATNTLTLGTNSNERIRITSSGQFGFGTNSPFQYGIATFNSINGIVLEGSSQSRLLFRHTGGGSNLKLMDIQASSHVMRFRHLDDNTTATIRFIINADGHVVPGTDSQYDLGLTGTRWRNVYADTLYGDGSNLTGITGTTINGNVDDYIITASGTANTLNGESSLLYTGSRMGINCSGGSITDVPATSHDTVVIGNSSMTSGGICLEGSSSSGNLGFQMYKQGSFLAARMLYEYSTNQLQFHSATGGTPGSGEAVRLRLKPDGDVQIEDGDLILASGHGIDFGATANGGTGTPNEIFDDYEEGSWTPAIEGLSNTPSYHNLGGTYTKIGNRVFIQCHIQINGSNKPLFTSQTAAFKISGLPFTGQGTNGTGYFGAHGVCVWQQLQWVGGAYSSYGHGDDTQLSPGIVDGGTRITLQTCGQGIYYTGQLINRALHNNYAPNIEFDMNYRTAT